MQQLARKESISIRAAQRSDLEAVRDIDQVTTRTEKTAYWRGIFERYVNGDKGEQIFLVAESEEGVLGFIIGEIRAWEFGSPPCGWVFALAVSPGKRESGIGQMLFEEVCQRLKAMGIHIVRTMIDRNNKLTLSFFRSQGMRTGPYIELEKTIEGALLRRTT